MNTPNGPQKPKLFSLINKDDKVYFNENKVCQFAERKNGKIFLKLDQNSQFFVSKVSKAINNSSYFILIKSAGVQLQLKIENQQQLEFAIKSLGKYCYGSGVHNFTEDFFQVGKGNFAPVYKFVSTYKTPKAMKMFQKKRLENTKDRFNFLNEVSILRLFDSPYIAGLDCVFETQKQYYLRMQFFEENLKSFVKKHITKKTQKSLMKNILLAMKELKQKNIIHRDIKPDNIMIRKKDNQEYEAVLIDFGLAAKMSDSQMTHKKCGTPGYIAPQIINMTSKTQIGFSVDIFSAGATFFYMYLIDQIERLSKKKPFSASNNKQMLYKNKMMIVQEYLYFYMSEKESDLIKRMIEKDPYKRISVEQALAHKYFDQQVDDGDSIPDEGCDLEEKLKELKIMDTAFMATGIELLFSVFKMTSRNLQQIKQEYFTRSLMSSEFNQLEIEAEEIEKRVNKVKVGVNRG